MPCLGLGTWELTRHTVGSLAEASDYGTQPSVAAALRETRTPRDTVYLERYSALGSLSYE